MPEFNLIPEARSSPTECALCKQHVGPFVDTGVEKLDGRILICASRTGPDGNLERSGCAEQIARVVGSLDKEQATALYANLGDATARIHELEQHIKDNPAQGPTVVPVDEVLKALEDTHAEVLRVIEVALKAEAAVTAAEAKAAKKPPAPKKP